MIAPYIGDGSPVARRPERVVRRCAAARSPPVAVVPTRTTVARSASLWPRRTPITSSAVPAYEKTVKERMAWWLELKKKAL